MIVQEFTLPKAEWRVKVYYSVTGYYVFEILEELRKIGCSGDTMADAYIQLYNCELNTGLTYSNCETHESVMVIASTSSSQEFANSLQHEQNHLKRHIAQTLGIDPYSEDESYLAGDISAAMHPVARKLLCSDCRADLMKRWWKVKYWRQKSL